MHDEISGTSKHDSFGVRDLLVTSRFRRPSKEGSSTYTAISAPLWETRQRRGQAAVGPALKRRRENVQASIAGDIISSAFRERGKAGVSSMTLVILPPDLVPMWGQMEESGDCCGFIQKKERRTEMASCKAWKIST